MAKTAFTLDTKTKIKAKAPADCKALVDEIWSALPRGKATIFADANWGRTKSSQWQWKVSEDEYESIAIHFGEKPNTKGFVNTGDKKEWRIKFLKSGKKSAKAADAKTTEKQERTSAWIIKCALKKNANFSKWEDIVTYQAPGEGVRIDDSKPFKTIYEVYEDVSEDWIKGYYAQQKKILDEFKKSDFTDFNHKGGFMKYISDTVKEKFGISQKDNWNPADIWGIKGTTTSIKNDIDKTIDGNGSQTIIELNAVLRKMFHQRRVVGISLKKISGSSADWREYNVRELGLDEDTYNYKTLKPLCNLNYNNGWASQDSRVVVSGNDASYDFQIKGNDTKKVSNLKFEPTEDKGRAARMGKAPVAMVQQLIKDNKQKLDFKNQHKEYPKDVDTFVKEEKEWRSIFKKVDKFADTKGVDEDTFVNNMKAALKNDPFGLATSKLMQMKFIAMLSGMKVKNRDEFMTDMVFLAAKKGKRFGPFGKLY
tara:strand:+ start:2916 stop:4358 length:1443 start_codon:yes stop_codon:yes gene_type:complete